MTLIAVLVLPVSCITLTLEIVGLGGGGRFLPLTSLLPLVDPLCSYQQLASLSTGRHGVLHHLHTGKSVALCAFGVVGMWYVCLSYQLASTVSVGLCFGGCG